MILHAIPLIKLFPPWGKSDTKDIGLPPSVPYCLSSHVPLIWGFSKVMLTTPDLTIHTVFGTWCLLTTCLLFMRGTSWLQLEVVLYVPLLSTPRKGIQTNQPQLHSHIPKSLGDWWMIEVAGAKERSGKAPWRKQSTILTFYILFLKRVHQRSSCCITLKACLNWCFLAFSFFLLKCSWTQKVIAEGTDIFNA